MTINLHLPSQNDSLRPTITVFGVGGAGGNAVNNMINARLEGVEFVVANTDAQALDNSLTDRAIQLGSGITRGLGAGADPQVGMAAAEESMDEIIGYMQGSNMVFITAGMGGGTGTGAAPVIAKAAKEQGILTVGVVTKPFQFEGGNRMKLAEQGLEALQQYVDTLIVIPNQNLFRLATEKTTFADAFRMADEVLHSGVRGVTDLMVKPGLVNLDFSDIRTVMREMGKAMMGTGEAEGEKRAVEAAESAISNPLLDDVSLKGARAALINITGGSDMTLFEVDEAANRIREEIDPDANIIFGSTFNDELEGKMRVSVVATGIESESGFGSTTTSSDKKGGANRPFSYMPPRAADQKRSAVSSQAAPAPAPSAYSMKENRPEPVRDTSYKPAPVEPVAERRNETMSASNARSEAPRFERTQKQEAPAVKEAQEEPAPRFIRRQEAAQPAAQPVYQPVAQNSEVTIDVEDDEHGPLFERSYEAPEVEAPRKEPKSSGGFFGKIADVGRAISSRIEDGLDDDDDYFDGDYIEEEQKAPPREKAVDEKRKAEVRTSQAPVSEESDEYYDIPAFLRRQAN